MNSLIATTLIGWLACSSLLAAGSGPDSTALFQAIRNGDSAAVRKLLKAGADLQARNETGDTPLMSASTLLFLGYSLEDWDFRTIFKGLIETLDRREQYRSFAIQEDPSSFWCEYWESKKVTIYNVDLYEFAQELAQRAQAYPNSPPATAAATDGHE